MKRFKNWKSELKKRGAMALTAFMLCGSAGTAFAQSTNITIHDGEGGDIVIDGQPTPGNVKTVTGYQTDLAVGYAANITWGDMLFVYDRGTYDPATGELVGSFQNAEENANVGNNTTQRTDIEINGDREQPGFWYGFDGINNAVKIENLSTENVKLTATPEVTSENKGDVKFSLYVSSDANSWDVTSNVDSSSGGVRHDIVSIYDLDNGTWKTGDATSGTGVPSDASISRIFAARTFNYDGSENATDSDVIYLNITGRPDDSFMNQTTYNKQTGTKVAETLGKITLNFTIDDRNDLTEINGDTVPKT